MVEPVLPPFGKRKVKFKAWLSLALPGFQGKPDLSLP